MRGVKPWMTLLLDMVDFDVIMGMDWLFPCQAFSECFSKNITLNILSIYSVVWQGLRSAHQLGLYV